MKEIQGYLVMKYLAILFLSFLLFSSCNLNKRKQVADIIREFLLENAPDQRELLFSASAIYSQGKLIIEGETSEYELKTKLVSELESFSFIDKIVALPDSTVGDFTFALVSVPVANMRAVPKHSAELVSQAILGTPLKILKKQNDWFLIQTPDKYIAWIDASGIQTIKAEDFTKWRAAERLIYTGDFGFIYDSENMNNTLTDVPMGSIVQKITEGGNSNQIVLPDGSLGFIKKEGWKDFQTFKNSTSLNSEDVILSALKSLGRSYLWGGTSAYGLDCSGFVKTVYFMNGIILPRDASLQVNQGVEIPFDEDYYIFQPGDLLFFGQKESEKTDEKITHVALSLGGSEFIHSSGKVRRNSFNSDSSDFSEYRKNTFIRAKRIIGSESEIQTLRVHPWY